MDFEALLHTPDVNFFCMVVLTHALIPIVVLFETTWASTAVSTEGVLTVMLAWSGSHFCTLIHIYKTKV